MSHCLYCNIHVHSSCAPIMPPACGLPPEYSKEFSKISVKFTLDTPKPKAPIAHAWVKVPSNEKWVKRFIVLDGIKLHIYETDPAQSPESFVTKILLSSEDGKAKVFPEVTSEDCPLKTADTDLPFIINIDVGPHTTCWPHPTQLIMFMNPGDKLNFLTTVDEFVATTVNKYEVVTKLMIQEEVSFVLEIKKNTLLLGGDKGLYALTMKKLVLISGVQDVQQIEIVRTLNLCVILCGEKQLLVKTDLKKLESIISRAQFLKEPKVNVSNLKVNTTDGIIIFKAADTFDLPILCAGTYKEVFILRYDYIESVFIHLYRIDTLEPCSCFTFTDQSLVFGTDRFFEIDLFHFTVKDILAALDEDTWNKRTSYPIGVIEIAKDPVEYLICFSSHGSFVNGEGERTRNDIKWSYLPSATTYCPPFLCLIQYSGVEFFKLLPEDPNIDLSVWQCPKSTRVRFYFPRFLGSTSKGLYVRDKREVFFLNARKIVDGVDLDDDCGLPEEFEETERSSSKNASCKF